MAFWEGDPTPLRAAVAAAFLLAPIAIGLVWHGRSVRRAGPARAGSVSGNLVQALGSEMGPTSAGAWADLEVGLDFSGGGDPGLLVSAIEAGHAREPVAVSSPDSNSRWFTSQHSLAVSELAGLPAPFDAGSVAVTDGPSGGW